jgi:hypothetical protein
MDAAEHRTKNGGRYQSGVHKPRQASAVIELKVPTEIISEVTHGNY